jgi:hypothetical protein
LEHRAGDVAQPIAERAKGTCVLASASSQSRIRGRAATIVPRSDVIVSSLESFPSFRKRHGEDDAAVSCPEARIAASRCSFAHPGSLFVGSAGKPHSRSRWWCDS